MDFTAFLFNAALLIILSVLSSYFRYQWWKKRTVINISLGFLYGVVAIMAMTVPMRLSPGVIFDGRSIVLSIAGLFESPPVVILAAVIGSTYRLFLGGSGASTGVGSIILSSAIGLLFRAFVKKEDDGIHPLSLLLMGFVTHLVLLGWFNTLPRDIYLTVIRQVAIPYLTVFPIATMLIGMLMENQQQRLKAEERLAASEMQYRQLVNTLHEGIWMLDQQNCTVFVNPAMAEMLGYTPEEMLNRPAIDFLDPKDHEDFRQRVERRRQGVREQYERELIRKDGSLMPTLIAVAPLFSENGEYLGSLAGVQDITRRVEAEKKLEEQAQRLEEMVRARTRDLEAAQEQVLRSEKLATLGQLAGSVGHELRNPLSVISNAVYLLRSSLPERNVKTEDYLRLIEQEVKTASNIISELLDYASARVSPPEEVNLQALLESTLADVDIPKNITLLKKIAVRLPFIFGNPPQIRQILVNLITNACQAMPDGGTLTIAVSRYRGRVRLVVEDTGVGISRENMSRLFEPLFTTKPKGIGLGLALSKILAEMNDVSIHVASREGKGSCFTLILPIKKEHNNKI